MRISGVAPLALMILASCMWALWRIWKPSAISMRIANSGTRLDIVFGDIFSQTGVRAIGVSEFFETEMGRPVSERSLHGAFLKRHYSGFREVIDRQLDNQLATEKYDDVVGKTEGKKRCYPIGTTALVKANDDRYILFAITKAEHANCKVYSDVELMWRALHRLWGRARIECNGEPLNLPLVGSGLSGLNLPTRDLLNLLVLSVITESKAREITKVIRIVLWRDRFEDVDLREIKSHWEK